LNIDATRIAYADDEDPADFDPINNLRDTQGQALYAGGWSGKKKKSDKEKILDWANKYSSPGMKEYAKLDGSIAREHTQDQYKPTASPIGRFPSNVIGEIADYQKYFYCPKVSRRERHIGHETPPAMFGSVQGAYGPDGNRMAVGFDKRANKILSIGSTHPDDVKKHPLWDPSIGGDAQRLKQKILDNTPDDLKGNHHPTVKPIELMKYLIQLVTPPGGHVLDPFNGSGSTGCAAVELGYNYTGIELDPAYVDIAERRIQAWYQHTHPNTFTELFKTC
jgi:hypothetical protein